MKETKEVNIYSLRNKADKILRKVVRAFIPLHITPNFLTVLSLIFAAISAFFFYFSGVNSCILYLLLAGIFVVLSSIFDALDGPLAREMNIAGERGDFLDHAFDRYADVLFIGGIVFGGYAKYEIIGFLAVAGVLLTSYFGVQAQALGLPREYRGILGRAYRLVILILAVLLSLVYPGEIGTNEFSLPILGWIMLIFGALGILTAIQRTIYIFRDLPKSR